MAPGGSCIDKPLFSFMLCVTVRLLLQTGNSHMALLTAPEGSDLEEFKRTRAFMMTKDEDDSSSSSSSSSSRSERYVRWLGASAGCVYSQHVFVVSS